MNIAIAVDERFFRYGYVTLTSVFENHPKGSIRGYVLHRALIPEHVREYAALAEQYENTLVPLHVSERDFPSTFPFSDKWPVEVYFRLLLPYLLPGEERLLYLDTDIIVDQPLGKLYETDFGDALLCGVCDNSDGKLSERQSRLFSEIMASDPSFHYVNSGVLLMNLKELRKAYSAEDILATADRLKDQITAFDQDLINYLYHGRIRFLPGEKYNLFARIYVNSGYDHAKVKAAGTVIIHYTGPKPWSGQNLRTDIEKFWWDYARLTPFYHEFLEELVISEMEKGYENTNEFQYQKYLQQNLQQEIHRLRSREKEYQVLMEQSRAALEALVKNGG